LIELSGELSNNITIESKVILFTSADEFL